jgi:TonB family protein
MPTSVVPTSFNQPEGPEHRDPDQGGPEREPRPDSNPEGRTPAPTSGGSRWLDYDTHELLEMISDLEDERRWARLREGILWAVLFHILLISAITWIPKYVLRQPQVIDPFDAINKRKDLKYLDLPPDLVQKYQPKVAIKPVPQKQPQVDSKTLQALQREEASKPKPPAPQPQPPQQQAKIDQPVLPAPQPPAPAPQPAAPAEAPRPQSVPAKAFQLGSQNPADQLNNAMRGAAQNPGYGSGQLPTSHGDMSQHPGAGTGGVQVLSDTQGVDFNNWLIRWHRETERTWDPLIPDEVNPPILKQGVVVIRFKVLPNGQVSEMALEGRSGDTGLDRAAWGAIKGSSYPPLPREFHGPYLELRAVFMYNQRQ